jgi:hypothetical protein
LGNFNVVLDTDNLVSMPIVKHVVNNWTFGLLSTLQSGRPFPVSTGDGPSATTIFPALGNETAQRPNVLPNGTLVATNIGSASGTNLAISSAGVAACQKFQPAASCPAATTFLAPAGANPAGPADSYSGDPVDFQFFSGNLVRNAGQSLPLYRFDVSVKKAFKIPKWESAALELKMDVFNVFNHPLFILNNGNDNLAVIPINQPSITNAAGATVSNPNFACTAVCIDPNTGFYLGANGRPLNIGDFQRASHAAGLNFNGLGAPAATVTPRIIQLAIRFRW